ncbi:MAG: hypothetical protein IGS23_18810 [Rivularia sp. T60_A2020_040]|nr:hypothetical protein [Rivularia sp. T60_A2020_040]
MIVSSVYFNSPWEQSRLIALVINALIAVFKGMFVADFPGDILRDE